MPRILPLQVIPINAPWYYDKSILQKCQHFNGGDPLFTDHIFNMELDGEEMVVQRPCL